MIYYTAISFTAVYCYRLLLPFITTTNYYTKLQVPLVVGVKEPGTPHIFIFLLPTPQSYNHPAKSLVTSKGCYCQQYWLDQACSSFYAVSATPAKFGLQAGSKKFYTQNEEWTGTCIIIMYFYRQHEQWKYWKWIQICFVIVSPLYQGKG